MFANINNGQIAKKNIIIEPKKNIRESFLKILWDEGYISGYRISPKDKRKLEIYLKYTQKGDPVINSFKFLSKPGQRVYLTTKQIWKLDSCKTFIIFSTNKGLKSIVDCKKDHLGGEPLVMIS